MTRYGSDVVVDLLVEAGVEHVAFNPGATFRGIHDSLVHRDDAPHIVLCPHENIAVSVAHGFAKASGRPMAVLLHDVVGLQNASMAIYNAWCDRVPVLLIGGTGPLAKPQRRPWIDWIHTALVQGQLVRDYVKWDDQPADLASLPESFARAWTTMLAAPTGPVYLCVDAALQEQEAPPDLARHAVADYAVPTPPAPRIDDMRELAAAIELAALPVIVTDYAGDTELGFAALRALADACAIPVVAGVRRHSFSTTHELACTEDVLGDADLVVLLDVEDSVGVLSHARPDAPVWAITPAHLKLRAWSQDYQELPRTLRHITATADTALPLLLELTSVSDDRARRRRELVAERSAATRSAAWKEAATADGGGAVHPAQLAAELHTRLDGRPWTLVHGSLEGWERRLWPFDERGRHLGWHGGGGLGYGPGAALGAALALGGDRFCLNIQPDGDLLYAPAALWSTVRERVPLLTVMHNNRQYRNTVEHAARLGEERRASTAERHVGAALTDPNVDFAVLARSFGMVGIGPIDDPADVGGALDAAFEVVARGEPALVDVVTAGA